MSLEEQYHYEILDLTRQEIIEEYEAFVSGHENGSFMQSLNWRGAKPSWKSEAIAVRSPQGAVCAAMLILIKRLPLFGTSLLYSPRGPVCDLHNKALLTCLFDGAFALSRKYRACALRLDPFVADGDEAFVSFMKTHGFAFTPNQPDGETAQTRENYILPIKGKTPDELFAAFKPKWRYNIRLATRKGVECAAFGPERLNDFLMLMRQTGKRDGFAIRSKEYFKRMMESLGDDCRLYMCYKDGVPLSGAVCVRYGARTCYVYGASSDEHRGLMPNYLMQWSMICWACESGSRLYDFMGVPHYDDPAHSNYGVYRFKQGFGGQVAVYAGEFEYVYTKEGKRLWNLCFRAYESLLHLEHFIKSRSPFLKGAAPPAAAFYPANKQKHA